jgi:sulfite reductase (ferredoxin)
MANFLLGHDDVQDFGRKFKIAFSGCEHEACGLVNMHDFGLLARVQEVDGVPTRGFRMYVGGGLGTITYQAKILYDFVTEDQILPVVQAVSRVFARLGEKQNRNRARIKFLVAQLGWRSSAAWWMKNCPPCLTILAGRRSWMTCLTMRRNR